MGVIESLISYRRLLDISYNIVLGRKGKKTRICITFDKKDWRHVMGLQYLKDLSFLNVYGKDLEELFDQITNGRFSNETFEKSVNYTDEIVRRIELFDGMEDFLDSLNDKTVKIYGFDRKKCLGTSIQANFLLNAHSTDTNLFLFTVKRDEGDILYVSPLSFFSSANHTKDYTSGQMQYTVLCVEKENLTTSTTRLLYKHKNYSP